MDIEQLKMILDAVSVAGAGGKELLYAYMGVSVLRDFITACIVFVVIFSVLKLIGRIITEYDEAERLMHAAGVSYRWSENELDVACSILRQHYQEEINRRGGV